VTNSACKAWKFPKAYKRNAFVSYTAVKHHVAGKPSSMRKA